MDEPLLVKVKANGRKFLMLAKDFLIAYTSAVLFPFTDTISFSPRKHIDFIFTVSMRFIYNNFHSNFARLTFFMSVSAVSFLQYWLADIIGSSNPSSVHNQRLYY